MRGLVTSSDSGRYQFSLRASVQTIPFLQPSFAPTVKAIGMDYSNLFDFENWWADASHYTTHFFKTAGPVEMGSLACVVLVVSLLFMRGNQIR